MNMARLESACAWAACGALLMGALAGNTRAFKTRPLPEGLDSPLLAMQLLRTPADVSRIVGTAEDNDRRAMVRLVYIDFGFITTYCTLFLLAGCVLYYRDLRLTGIAVGVLGIVAGVFDVLENVRILQVLQGARYTPRFFSLTKWALISVALGGLARVYICENLLPVRRSIGYLAAFCSGLAAILGLSGVTFRIDPLIETGGKLMGVSLMLGWLFFATHSLLADGLLPALKRLTTRFTSKSGDSERRLRSR